MMKRLGIALFALLLLPAPARAQTDLPAPQLVITGTELYRANGTAFRRYRFEVTNRGSYPAALFAAAPWLPRCGNNPNPSRTAVDFFAGGAEDAGAPTGRRVYGLCALAGPGDLASLSFALPSDQLPPASVTIVMVDRQTHTSARSNAVSLSAEALMARAEAMPGAAGARRSASPIWRCSSNSPATSPSSAAGSTATGASASAAGCSSAAPPGGPTRARPCAASATGEVVKEFSWVYEVSGGIAKGHKRQLDKIA